MTDPYEALAEVLNKIPQSFPPTDDGTHIKVLQWIFTPEEAELTSKMRLMAETAEELSERLKIPLEGLKEKLESMHIKGQINAINTRSGKKFGLMPFVVGIYEEQLGRMDAEFAQLIEDYFEKSKLSGLFNTEPPVFRVVPVNQVIQDKTEVRVHTYQQAEEIINQAQSWGIRDCICKIQQNLIGKECEFVKKDPSLLRVCLNFASKPNYYDGHHLTTPITKEEAFEYLKKARDAGLIHNTSNTKTGNYYICNCCTCCCGVLRALTERHQPLAFVNSDYYMTVDEELCVGCGTCLDRCQFDALDIPDDVCVVDTQRCVGCGVCAIVCPEEAMGLKKKDPSELSEPPENLREWMTQKAMSRQVDPSDLL